MKPVSSLAVGNAVLARARGAGRSLTNMQVQQLVYLSHGYMLALEGAPLYLDQTRAYQWGPVIPTLYNALRKYGAGIVAEDTNTSDTVPDEAQDVISAVWNNYGNLSGKHLSTLARRTGTPWARAWSRQHFSTIPDEWIADYYDRLAEPA